ncbi:MAG: hypothetical protein ICV51_04750 [Flavisolibacter sp.]|nr:hypothetical protein [Flavisolibacter sp.]MBD0374921.1 hypothetical protein [Flavisolibacter sp.]
MKYFLLLLAVVLFACNSSSEASGQKDKHQKKNKEKEEEQKQKSNATAVVTKHEVPGGCDTTLWKYVYNPKRLQVLDKCKTITGVIEERNADEDGDEHMLLKLDKGQENLLLKKNYKKKQGDLVIEAVCINKIKRKIAKGACTGYTNNVWLPSVGDHVRVTGSYVIDSHNGWTEIHPITSIEKL